MDFINQVGVMFTPLSLLSLLALTVILERTWFYIRLPSVQNAASYKALTAELQANKSAAKPLRDELISYRLLDLQSTLQHGLHLLRTVAVVAPMVGLLGTVLGMIDAFRDISAIKGPVAPNMIADGLWAAMLTTAYGLSIALPSLFAAFMLTRFSEKRLQAFQRRLNAQSLAIEGITLDD